MSDTAYQTPLIDLLKRIPANHRTEWAIQWSEDGTETGHAMCPIGRLAHEAAARIEELEAASQQVPEGVAIVPVETQKNAARYEYVKSFMRTDDVGDDEVYIGLCIKSEDLEEAVSQHLGNRGKTIDEAIDAAMLAAAKGQ